MLTVIDIFSKFVWIIALKWKTGQEVANYNGEEIQGSFYEQELQKTKQDIFRIANIIKQQEIRSLLNG